MKIYGLGAILSNLPYGINIADCPKSHVVSTDSSETKCYWENMPCDHKHSECFVNYNVNFTIICKPPAYMGP